MERQGDPGQGDSDSVLEEQERDRVTEQLVMEIGELSLAASRALTDAQGTLLQCSQSLFRCQEAQLQLESLLDTLLIYRSATAGAQIRDIDPSNPGLNPPLVAIIGPGVSQSNPGSVIEEVTSCHPQLEAVRRQESRLGGNHYLTNHRRSPRQSASGRQLSPLLTGSQVQIPLSRSLSGQGSALVQVCEPEAPESSASPGLED
ncbi:uncharacterized protein LOC136767929 isoform X2 [Amia ocellicauda]|uniref:uncharacterized protein LOC136767929 isoform X2 n=1 Tax=Amia ocellicauda TaxID=2972642 RepID=UPI003463B321